MVSLFDVPISKLVSETAQELKKSNEITPPEWSKFVKTGAHKERPPEQKDWWHTRAAAVLCAIAKRPTGVGRLRTKYGGRKNRGMKPEHMVKGSGKIIRVILQQLEKEGLVAKSSKGRNVTPKGMKLLNSTANKIKVDKNG